jgi:hypothetical protein
MFKTQRHLRTMIAIAISLAGLTLFASCDKDDSSSKKENTTVYNAGAIPQSEKDAVYASYAEDPAMFELSVALVYEMAGKEVPTNLNPNTWTNADWEDFMKVSAQLAEDLEQVSTDLEQME